ncbi:MAG: hypothetical protein KDK30_05105 [Leptospiraceae bacterium]|nr:hypothetical protein [Leptospiraceae bacterium]MCB1314728.1 hypothetical protein [Leptospiraceae bacterium]
MRKLFTLTFVCMALALQPACFHILHVLHLNAQNQMQISWRLTVARAIQEMDQQNNEEGKDFTTRMDEMVTEMRTKFEDERFNPEVNKVETDSEVGFQVNVNAGMNQLGAVGEKLRGVLPVYSAANKTLTLSFEPDQAQQLSGEEDEQTEAAQDEDSDADEHSADRPKGEDKDEQAMDEGNAQMDELGKRIAQLMGSSATYDLILSGNLDVESVTLINRATGARKNITLIPAGDVVIARFSLMDLAEAEEGSDLILKLK